MALQDHPLEFFFDLLADMPDIETVDEIDTRLQGIVDTRQALGESKGQLAKRQALNYEEDQLRLHRHKLVFRLEQRKWSKAVRAVFGDEGFDQCMEWIRASGVEDIQQAPIRRNNVKGTARA